MGESTPGEYPEIDLNKWYCCYTTFWTAAGTGCGDVFGSSQSCCYQGNDLKVIIDSGGFCALNCAICFPPFPGWESLDEIAGPYDTQVLCNGAC